MPKLKRSTFITSFNAINSLICHFGKRLNTCISLSVFIGFIISPVSTLAAAGIEYNLNRVASLCDGYPQLPISTADGLCVGLYADKALGFKMPRYAAELSSGLVLVSDMGGWAYNRGTVWALIEKQNKVTAVDLFPNNKLTMPNGIAVDPKGLVYVGTPQGIYRFNPLKSNGKDLNINPELQIIVDDFKNSIFRKHEYINANSYNAMAKNVKNKHPLVNFVFNSNFTELYVNIGAPSDDCKQGLVTLNANGLCEQTEGRDAGGIILKYLLNSNQEVQSRKVFARGLRNSMALALHPRSNQLLQGENSRDYKEADRPDEELNLILEDKHYGWPYCYNYGQVAEEYSQKFSANDCLGAKFTPPLVHIDPHAAPLGMSFYQSDRIPQLQNKLLISLHGYRDTGHRLIAYPVDDNTGLPLSNEPEELIFDWESSPSLNPQGAPVGLLELYDGSVLIVDDKNKNILRLSTGMAVNKKNISESTANDIAFSEKTLSHAQNLQTNFFANKCSVCHSQFKNENNAHMLKELIHTGLILPRNFKDSPLYQKLEKKQMPPTPETDLFYTEVLSELRNLINSL